jgi:hypothetical protein
MHLNNLNISILGKKVAHDETNSNGSNATYIVQQLTLMHFTVYTTPDDGRKRAKHVG